MKVGDNIIDMCLKVCKAQRSFSRFQKSQLVGLVWFFGACN